MTPNDPTPPPAPGDVLARLADASFPRRAPGSEDQRVVGLETAQAIALEMVHGAITHLQAERERLAGQLEQVKGLDPLQILADNEQNTLVIANLQRERDQWIREARVIGEQRDAARAELATAREHAARREEEVRREALEEAADLAECWYHDTGVRRQLSGGELAAELRKLAAPPAAPGVSRG